MLDAIKMLVTAAALTAVTVGGYAASTQGWGLPGMLDEPVSIRQESVLGSKGPRYHYFIGRQRSHLGGGFHGGK